VALVEETVELVVLLRLELPEQPTKVFQVELMFVAQTPTRCRLVEEVLEA
jgi:hypothetical protein